MVDNMKININKISSGLTRGSFKSKNQIVPFPKIPSPLWLCDYVLKMITTRIIAALMAPSAGLLTIVGALPLLYTNPSRTQTYPPPLGQTTFLGPFSTWRKHKKSRVKILSNRRKSEDQKLVQSKILVAGDDGLVQIFLPRLYSGLHWGTRRRRLWG